MPPERIIGPYSCIARRSGNAFELATVAASLLAGAGYDAYVAVGCAARDTCLAVRYRTPCPDVPDETPVVEDTPPPEEEPRYRLVPLPDLDSKFLQLMAEKERAKLQADTDRAEEARRMKVMELEEPPPDAIDTWRVHAWVLVLPGPMGVEQPFFIEPSEGNAHPTSAAQYQRLSAVYNHENYYVNLQNDQCWSDTLDRLVYDLADLNCWERLLAGEPFRRRNMAGVDPTDRASAVDTEKHLDMPASWVEKLEISADEHRQRYPGSHKTVHYKKVILEKFAPYSEVDGLVKRIKVFADYALTIPTVTHEYYEHRVDKMVSVRIDHDRKVVREKFADGRKEYLIQHEYAMSSPPLAVGAERTLEFFYYARLDHLTKLVCTELSFDEYYTDREDRLETRIIKYVHGEARDSKRVLHTVTETYSRNPDLPAKDDVWQRIFHISDNTIELLYHYEYNFVTNNTRSFVKPNLAETGGEILFYPDKTTGYIADPVASEPRPLQIYYDLCDNMAWEYETSKQIRDHESDLTDYLKQRHKELTEPRLQVALYDTEKNEEARKGWIEQETQKALLTEREKEAEIDPLAPYLARLFGLGRDIGTLLTVKEAALVREQCMNDFKGRQLARQVLVQERFDKMNAEYKEKRLWYLANQFILTPAKESAYFIASAELAFEVHSLEVRLTRHRDLSGARFKAVELYLEKHPLLRDFIKSRLYFRHA